MTLIRPCFQEDLYHTLFNLESDRPKYYSNVVRLAKSLFMSLGFKDQVKEINDEIYKVLEKPLNAPFVAIVEAFDTARYRFSKRAFTRIGDNIDYVEVTFWEIQLRLEKIKDFVYDKVTQLSPYIRFTRSNQSMV